MLVFDKVGGFLFKSFQRVGIYVAFIGFQPCFITGMKLNVEKGKVGQ